MVNRPCSQFWSWKPWMPCSMQGRCHYHPQTRWPVGSLREISQGEPTLCPRNEGLGAGQGIILNSHTITLGWCFYLHLLHLLAVHCNAIHHFRNEKEIGAEILPAIVSGIVIGDAPSAIGHLRKPEGNWPIADRRVSSNDPRNNCSKKGTPFVYLVLTNCNTYNPGQK